MKQEDKELLLKELCARLPYKVICKVDNINFEGELREIGISYNTARLYNVEGDESENVYVYDCKPYLFPLSNITEEQMEELEELCTMYTPDDDYQPYAHMGIKVLYKHVLDDGYTFRLDFNTDVIDWLNKNHFDYNGLIEKGLAIDASNKNIY